MNLSRAYALAKGEPLSVGRVQTPTLAMVVDRELEIRSFVPERYLQVVATFQPSNEFGRVLAAYGGVFVAGSLAWGIIVDGFAPTVWDYVGSAVALLGAAIIILAPGASAASNV
jgi:small multidrug resistance family-3 protein